MLLTDTPGYPRYYAYHKTKRAAYRVDAPDAVPYWLVRSHPSVEFLNEEHLVRVAKDSNVPVHLVSPITGDDNASK